MDVFTELLFIKKEKGLFPLPSDNCFMIQYIQVDSQADTTTEIWQKVDNNFYQYSKSILALTELLRKLNFPLFPGCRIVLVMTQQF